MTFTAAFKDILSSRQMSLASLAERTGISLQALQQATKSDDALDEAEIHAVADELGVPMIALFALAPLTLSEVPDFRRATPTPGLFHKGTISGIGFVERISQALSSLPLDLNASDEIEPYNGPLTKPAAHRLATEWRKRWGLNVSDQLEWRSSHKVYVSLRNYIEGLGIFVIHRSFGTDEVAGIYSKVNGGPHTILINTYGSSKARKLFTLAHEFCHVLLRATGASNPSIVKNKIETFCNQFAAVLLAPENLVRLAINRFGYGEMKGDDQVRLLANNLGVSQHCTVLRLLELDLWSQAEYARWRSKFSGSVPPADTTDGQGGGASDVISNKKTQYGSALIERLAKAKRNGLLDDIDIYRLVGLKPKYQKPLLGA